MVSHVLLGFACLLLFVVSGIDCIGPLCFQCQQVPHQRDCTRIVRCGDHEKCSGKSYITSDGNLFYESGCESTAACASVKKKRIGAGDTYICDKCCDGDYCNENICDTSNTNSNRCLFCDDVINVNDCRLSIVCDDDQICYTQSIYVNKQPRYRLGCAPKTLCKNQTAAVDQSFPPLVGKRSEKRDVLPSGDNYCGKCCNGTNCNLDLCVGQPGGIDLITSPQFLLCVDYDTSECQTRKSFDQTFCQQTVNKDYLCPRTCGTCSGGGLPLPTAAASTVTTSSVAGCIDEENNCKQPLIQAEFCKLVGDKCRKTCGLCGTQISTLTPVNTTVTTVVPSTSAPPPTTTSPIVTTSPMTSTVTQPSTTPKECNDPIPKCQCEYLDREISICNNNRVYKQLCCYYCNKKNNNYTCEDPVCESAEKPEQAVVDSLVGNITCTV